MTAKEKALAMGETMVEFTNTAKRQGAVTNDQLLLLVAAMVLEEIFSGFDSRRFMLELADMSENILDAIEERDLGTEVLRSRGDAWRETARSMKHLVNGAYQSFEVLTALYILGRPPEDSEDHALSPEEMESMRKQLKLAALEITKKIDGLDEVLEEVAKINIDEL